MVEMDSNIASDVTVERLARVINGYTTTKGKSVEGLGSGFQFCRLSEEPLFKITWA
jgi:site-specific DNA-methyltransferase (adenine-specific)/adenine-specific DNA-methyltransferase